MTALTITVGKASWNGISARVTRVGEADGRRASRMLTRKVVVSADGRVTSIDVSPGEYVIEAMLPTGDVVTGACTVSGLDPVSIDIGGMRSSDGTIASRHMGGQGARDYDFPSAAGMLSLSLSGSGDHLAYLEPDVFTAFPTSRSSRHGIGSPTALPAPAGRHSPWRATSKVDIGRLRFPLASRVVTGADGTVGYEIDAEGASGAPGPVWMEFDKGSRVEKAMLPIPWLPDAPTPIGRGRVRVDVPADGPPRVSVGESRFDAMLGYLANRRITEARDALETLADEVLPAASGARGSAILVPFAYLAACYVGILEHDGSTEQWGRLAQSFHRACPTSVDAMVATARYLLVTARDDDDLNRARSLFMDASEGPPPTITVGVQILLDGLSAFADEDEAVAVRRKAFVQVARDVDIGQPFTVLTCARELNISR